jgi:hypothetical protein
VGGIIKSKITKRLGCNSILELLSAEVFITVAVSKGSLFIINMPFTWSTFWETWKYWAHLSPVFNMNIDHANPNIHDIAFFE